MVHHVSDVLCGRKNIQHICLIWRIIENLFWWESVQQLYSSRWRPSASLWPSWKPLNPLSWKDNRTHFDWTLRSRISTHGVTCSCPRPFLVLLSLFSRGLQSEAYIYLNRISSLPSSCFFSLHFLFSFFLLYYHLILTSVLSISRFFKHLTWLDFSSLYLQKLWVCAAVKVCNRADIL